MPYPRGKAIEGVRVYRPDAVTQDLHILLEANVIQTICVLIATLVEEDFRNLQAY